MLFERNEEVPSVKPDVPAELIRRNTDDDMRGAVHRERLADDVGVGAQTVLPEPVVQDDDGLCSQRSSADASNPAPRASATPSVLK